MKEIVDLEERKFRKVDSKESILTAISLDQKRYSKITPKVKTDFLDLIVNRNCSIKKAAQILNINYSSAKSIISCFRKQSIKTFHPEPSTNSSCCEFKQIQSQTSVPILTLYCSVGRNQSTQHSIKTNPPPIKRIKIVHIITPQ